jgi:branched-chain amino acid transport system substrate-binding protein
MRGRTLKLSMAMLIAALAVSLAIFIAACGDDNGGGDGGGEPVKIGAIVSLTGSYATLGEPEKNVLEAEVKKINDAGGVNGHEVELIIEDDATDDAKAVAAASKLIEQDEVVAIIGSTGTAATMAIRGDIDRAKIPNVSMAGGTVITNPVDPLVFATPWSNLIVAPFTLDFMKQQGISKVALISDSGGFGADGQAVVTKAAPDAGVEIVADETFNSGDTDFSAQLKNMEKSGADAILIWTAGPEAAAIVKAVKDLGIDMPVYGSHGNARIEFVEGAGAAADGFRFAAGKVLLPEAYGEGTDGYKVATDFIDSYTEQFGSAPSTFAGHAYDSLYLITEAIGRIDGDVTPEAIRDELEKTSGWVGVGGTFTMSPEDHNGISQDDLTMYEIQDGAWVQAQ